MAGVKKIKDPLSNFFFLKFGTVDNSVLMRNLILYQQLPKFFLLTDLKISEYSQRKTAIEFSLPAT